MVNMGVSPLAYFVIYSLLFPAAFLHHVGETCMQETETVKIKISEIDGVCR